MSTALTWTNIIALLGVDGLPHPFAMANDDPKSGPLLRHGVLDEAGPTLRAAVDRTRSRLTDAGLATDRRTS